MNRRSSDSAIKPSALFLSPEAPYPPIGGGPLRSASLLEYLARSYDVHLVTFREAGATDPTVAIPAGKVSQTGVIELPYHSKRAISRLARNATRLVRGAPPLVDRFAGFEPKLQSLLAGNRYDLAIVEHFWCAPYLALIRSHCSRVVLDLHNIESAWYATAARNSGSLRRAALYRFAAASKRLERELLPNFDWLLVASLEDSRRVHELAAGVRVLIYPNALPEMPAPVKSEREEIAFSGNLEYAPNVEAVRFFHSQIWPRLRARNKLKWRIIGKNPHAIASIVGNDPQIELTGFVEDAVTELARAQVAVAPVMSGSGTRVKILEAWAAATPVVSTSLGAEGLGNPIGQLLIADHPRQFASAVERLLDSPEERRRIGCAGRLLYEQRYTWPAAWRSLRALLVETPRREP